ncbi:uncharacterized protein [Littorina saxatilis]|uniref:uncharacterized protein n=1 Tax=Littorina saxatilis TaxID=31220 RepID=UPI0038B51041
MQHLELFRQCQRESSTASCTKCCHAADFHVDAEERGCDRLCAVTHHGNKRQVFGHGFHDLELFRQCQRESSTASCTKCCHAADFHVDAEERGCDRLCAVTHHGNKRQVFGHGFHDLELFRQCQRESSTASCTKCCHAADFHVDAEERGCDRLCAVTHHGNKRQLLGGIFGDVKEIQHCEREGTTERCTQCCHSAHFTLPLEERRCDTLCAFTHLGGHHQN